MSNLSLALLTGGRQHILPMLAEDSAWRRTRLKSADGAVSILVALAKRVCIDEARALILPDVQHWYKAFVKDNGPAPADIKDNWYDAFDDQLLELFEPFTDKLSSSWLFTQTTDAKLWIEGEDERLANKFGEEIWKQLTWSRSDRQILSAVGIVADDLIEFGELGAEPVSPPQPEYRPTMINAIINKIMLNFPDPNQLAEDLDFVSDKDPGLAVGAAQRLGITMDEAKVMQQARAHGAKPEAWAKAVQAEQMLEDGKVYIDLAGKVEEPDNGPELPANLVRTDNASATPPPPPPPPPVGSLKERLSSSVGAPPPPPPPSPPTTQTGAAPAAPGKPGRKKNSATPPAGHIDVSVLKSIKEHSGLTDEILSEILGISRPTLGNIMKGKGFYVPPDESRRTALHNTLEKHINALAKAAEQVGIPF